MMAIWRRGKPDALLHHSDQGSQYSSEQFQKLLADHGVTCSMSRSGVWDNAAMESFFSSLKTERTARKVYRTRDQARADVFDYIERFYNRVGATRPSGISALWSSSGSRRQLKPRVHETGSNSERGSTAMGGCGVMFMLRPVSVSPVPVLWRTPGSESGHNANVDGCDKPTDIVSASCAWHGQ